MAVILRPRRAATASRFAQESRDAQAADPTNLPARFGRMLQTDSERAAREIKQDEEQNNPELIAQRQNTAEAEGFWDNLKAIKDNPLAFTNTLAQSGPAMAAGVGAGSVVSRAGGSLGRVSTTGILSESATSAMMNRQQVRDQVLEMPEEKLGASPRYQEIVEEVGGDRDKARALLANELADQVPLPGAVAVGLGSVLTNRLFGGDATAKSIVGGERMTAREFRNRAAQDTLEEGVQGVPEDVVQHGATVQADPTQKLDLGGSLAQNTAAGLAMGGTGHGIAYGRDRLAGRSADTKTQDPDAAQPPAKPPKRRGALPEEERIEPTLGHDGLTDQQRSTRIDIRFPDGTVWRDPGPQAAPQSTSTTDGGAVTGAGIDENGSPNLATRDAVRTKDEHGRLTERLAELNDPANGYGEIFDAERDDIRARLAEMTRPTPEPAADLKAQLEAVRDPESAKDAMLVARGNSINGLDLSGLHSVPTEQGVFITSNDQKAAQARANAESLSEADMALLLGYGQEKTASDGTVVQARNKDGGIVHQEATTQDGIPAAQQRAQAAAPNGTVEITGAQAVQAERSQRRESEAPAPVVLQNRDRSSKESIAQVNAIAASPDYMRTGPSRSMDQGAPVVFGDLPEGAALGKTETVVDGRGKRYQVQYAVVDARDLIASHQADGTPVAAYRNGEPGKLRAVAGNARTSGLQEAYGRGTAGTYRAELLDDHATTGADRAKVERIERPILVRVMRSEDVTADIGDRSNIQAGLQMSAVEQANNDVRRMHVDDMTFDDGGDPTHETVQRFVAATPDSERGGMFDSKGQPTTQLFDRIKAAAFKQAYDNDELVELAAQARDPDARSVLGALASVAGDVAALSNAGEYDIRGVIAEAAGMAVTASRKGEKLADVLRTRAIDENPDTVVIAQFMAENARSGKRIADGLRRLARQMREQIDVAASNADQGNMFGETPTLTRAQVLGEWERGNNTERTAQQSRVPERAAQDAAGRNTESGRAEGSGGSPGLRAAQTRPAEGGRVGAQAESGQRDAQGRQGAWQGAGQPVEGSDGWVYFAPETGTIGIPRAQMPQIKGKDRGALTQFLAARGIVHETLEQDPKDLKPTQAEFAPAKAKTWDDVDPGVDRSVLVSSDGHILDGHHQWVAALATGERIKTIRFDAPIKELLAATFQFPSAGRGSGADIDRVRAANRQKLKDALGDLASIATKHQRAAMVPEEMPGLMSALVSLMEAGIVEVGYAAKDLIAYGKRVLKADARFGRFWNKISEATWRKAAQQAIDRQAAQHVDDLFAQARPGGNDAKVAMIDGRPYDAKRDNFVPPKPEAFVDPDLLAAARKLIDRFFTGSSTPKFAASAAEKSAAEADLEPAMALARADKVAFDQAVIDVAGARGIGQIIAPIKSMDSAVRKVINEYDGDASKISDLLRATVVVGNYDDAASVVKALAGKFDVVIVKNKAGADLSGAGVANIRTQDRNVFGGYADVSVIVKTGNGTLAEIQINTPPMLAVKDAEGHKLYEAARVQDDGSTEKAELDSAMMDVYEAAFDASTRRDSETQPKNAASDDAWHLETGSPRTGANSTESSSKRNQRPSGNLTNSSPPKDERNSLPGGNLSGTFIGTSDTGIVAQHGQSGNGRKSGGADRAALIGRLRATLAETPQSQITEFAKARTALRNAVAADAQAAIDEGVMPAYQREGGLLYTMSPSARHDGKIQVTRYNNTGILSDSIYNNVSDAITQENLTEIPRLSDEDAARHLQQSVDAESERESRIKQQADANQRGPSDSSGQTTYDGKPAASLNEMRELRAIVDKGAFKKHITTEQDGRFTRVFYKGKQVTSLDDGRVLRADLLKALDRNIADEQKRGDQFLESHTQADLQARQDAKDKAERQQAKDDAKAEDKAKADAQRDEFTLTGSDRAADASPNQGGLFQSKGDNTANRGSKDGQQASGIPQGLRAERTADTDRLEKIIDRQLERDGEPTGFKALAVRKDQLPDALRGALAALERATGTRVVIFRNLTPGIADFNGVTVRDGVIYVEENSQNPVTSTAAHEWVHNLRKTNPGLYKLLADEVLRQGDAFGFAKEYGYSLSEANEELTASAVGDALTDPVFLQRLAERDQSAFKRVVKAFIEFLNTLTEGWQNQGSNAYLKDVEAFRDKLVEVLDQLPAAQQREGGVRAMFLRLWHGTPHRGIEGEGFKLTKIGTGEGAQAYGWGIYGAEDMKVAIEYQKKLSEAAPMYLNGEKVTDKKIANWLRTVESFGRQGALELAESHRRLAEARGDEAAVKDYEEEKKFLESDDGISITREPGQLYSLDVPIEELGLLDWDKPLSEQPPKVREALARLDKDSYSPEGDDYDANETGQMIYHRLANSLSAKERAPGWDSVSVDTSDRAWSGERRASETLREHGIPGLRYLDGNSRNRPLRDIKREFLNELPEDAGFEDVTDLFGDGTFSPKNEALLKALAANDWLGFDYPAQAVSAALGRDSGNFDMSGALRQAIADAQEGGTRNYVIWDESLLTPEAAGIKAMYSKKAKESTKRDLIITHNLSSANLLHAAKMGGLAAPSLAVTTNGEPLDGFGNITLIGKKEMADPKNGVRVFGADIYSPRYPNVERKINRKMYDELVKRIKGVADELQMGPPDGTDLSRSGYDALEKSGAMLGQFLKDNGIEPKVILEEGMSQERADRLRKFGLGEFLGNTDQFAMLDNPKFREAGIAELVDMYVSKGLQSAADELKTSGSGQTIMLRGLAREITMAARRAEQPEANHYATIQALREQIEEAKLSDQYEQAVEDVLNQITTGEVIFTGFTNSGNRRYIPHTLENVIKTLKKDLRGGEGFNYGVGSLRAKVTPQFRSVAAIRANKNRLVSDKQFAGLKDEIDNQLVGISRVFHEPLDRTVGILEDAASRGFAYAQKEYGIKLSDGAIEDATKFLDKLRALPTAYFEAKLLRTVYLSEFAAAVVPEGISNRALKALKDGGIERVETYKNDGDSKNSRRNAVKKLTDDLGDEVLFSRKAADELGQQGYIDGRPYRPEHEALSAADKRAVVDAYNANATTKLDSIGKIEDSDDIGAKSRAFQALAQSEGWHFGRDAEGAKYFWIRNADGATLNVRVSDHANVNRGEHYKTSDINIAPDDGQNGFDTFSSALWKMRRASLNDDGDTLIDGEEPVRFSRKAAQPSGATVSTITDAIHKAYGNALDALQAKGLVTLAQTQDEAIEAAAKARAAKTGQSLDEAREGLLASVRGEADELSMSIYSDEAGKIERALDAMGLQVSTEGSSISQSTYVIVESPEYTQTEGESGSVLKIRVSDHRLPGGYQQPDFEVQVGNAHQGVDMADAAGAWFDAVSWVGRRFGIEPKGAAKRQIAAAAEKEAKAKQAAVAAADQQRGRLDASKARLQAWLQSLPDGALWGNARRGGWVAVLDGKMIGRFDGETATGEGQPWYGGPYPVEAQKNLQPVRESLRASVKNSVADRNFDPNDIDIRRSASGSIQGFYDPQSGQSFLIADGLTDEAAPGVLIHEVGIHMAADKAGGRQIERLFRRAGFLLKNGKGKFFDAVRQRMESAGETGNEEAAAYIAEEYERDRLNAPPTIARYIREFLAEVKAWLSRQGVSVDALKLGPADIAAIARANTRALAAGGQTEPNAGQSVREKDSTYQTDLFGDPVPVPAARKRGDGGQQSAGAGLRGDVPAAGAVRDTPAPAGTFFVRTIVGQEVKRKLGARRITTPAQAAQATQYLYRNAVEQLDGIVTDKDGKPLAVVGGFKGATAQANVQPSTIVAEAVRIPGAAHLWLSHNHPSGNNALSRADEAVANNMADILRGSGIEPMGILAVSKGRFSFYSQRADSVTGMEIPKADVEMLVPVIERELAENEPTEALSGPQQAIAVAKLLATKGGTGLMLLNAQNSVVGWVPVTKLMLGDLRGTGGLNAVYRAISESNASAAILVHAGLFDQPHPSDRSVTVGNNIAAALAKIEVRPLDIINAATGKSAQQSGLDIARGPVYSKGAHSESGDIRFSRKAGGGGLPRGADVIADFRNDEPLKAHADYKAAKAGDVDAAMRLARDLVKPASLARSRQVFGPDAIFVPVHAQEMSGKNKIPLALALTHADAAGGAVATGITQSNKAFHTGAKPMERLMNRAEFSGPVQAGASYVLVDDVSTMGSTLADLAAYIQRNGGRVAGSVLLVNATRDGTMDAAPATINELEARHGQAIRDILGIDAAQLTGPEARYLIGFKSADEIRSRAAKARLERVSRLRAKEILPESQAGVAGDLKLSRAASQSAAPQPRTAAERARGIIETPARGQARPLEAITHAATRLTGAEKLTQAVGRLVGQVIDRVTPEAVKAGMVADYGLPEDAVDARTIRQGRLIHQLRKVGELVDKLATMTAAEAEIAYEWMTSKDPQVILRGVANTPPEAVPVLREIRALVDKLGQDAVDLGLLSPTAYDRNKGAYLHRSYEKYVLEEGGKAKRVKGEQITGQNLHRRGIMKLASMALVKQGAPEWWDIARKQGKADPDLIGRGLIRLQRRAASGDGTKALDGFGEKAQGSVRETVFVPADQPIPAKYSEWTHAGEWEIRGTKGEQFEIWRDYTPEERKQMGEIRDVRHAVLTTLHGMIQDVETANYFRWLSRNYAKTLPEDVSGKIVEASEGYLRPFRPDEWVQVPDSKAPGTNAPKYGAMAGKYVPGPVWNDIRHLNRGGLMGDGEFAKGWNTALKLWKVSKTSLSPVVHLNNIMSNFVMMDWADVSAGHLAKAMTIIMGAHARDGAGLIGGAGNLLSRGVGIADAQAAREVMKRYLESGGEMGSWVVGEMQREQLDPVMQRLMEQLGAQGDSMDARLGVSAALQHLLHGQLGDAARAFWGSKPAAPIKLGTREAKALIDLYGKEDSVFRLAAWLKAKEDGKSDIEAGKLARRSFMDYNINAPWVQLAKGTAIPFISFSYRALPLLADMAANKPHKLLKLMGVVGGLSMLFSMMAGGGDDDEVRRLLPDEKAGNIWGLVPKLVRMPWNKDDAPVFLDVRRWVPLGDVVDVGQGHGILPIPPALLPSGPAGMLIEAVTNKSQFTGRPITLETDTPEQKTAKFADWLYKSMAPNIVGLPGTYATQNVVNAIKGKTDVFGREQSVAQAVASGLGFKIGAYPADVLKHNMLARTRGQIGEIDRGIAAIKRQAMVGGITRDEAMDLIAVEQAKKKSLLDGAREKMGR